MISAIARERYPALHQREAVQRYLERLEANPDLRRQLKNDPDLRFKELLQI
jgi:hypothetical protein